MSLLDHDCERREAEVTRRSFLQGSLGSVFGALLLPGWLTSVRSAAAAPGGELARSLIILWMSGGPSHIDTFDPKAGPTAGPFRSIETRVPGLRLCEHLPRTAEVADELVVIRSMTSLETNHARARYLMKTGYDPDATVRHPALGSVVSRELGDPDEPIPPFVTVNSPSVGPGFLGNAYSALHVTEAGTAIENLAPAPGIEGERFQRRLDLLRTLESQSGFASRGPESSGLLQQRQRAINLMLSPKGTVFDLSREPAELRQDYGLTPFGQGCLLARRLVETGCRCIEVTLSGWDTHEDNFNRHRGLLEVFDPAFAALMRDLARRDLLRSTLVLAMGEFGRTPEIMPASDGRHHHSRAFSAVLAGSGLRKGRVHGQTDERGETIVAKPVTIPDVLATLCVRLGISPDLTHRTTRGRPVKVLDTGEPVREILA